MPKDSYSMFCALCGDHARHPKSPVADLRRKACPRFAGGVIHRGCCAQQACSETDARGHVRCGWERGGRERLEALPRELRLNPGARRASASAASAPASEAEREAGRASAGN